jgi:hypothetical protein
MKRTHDVNVANAVKTLKGQNSGRAAARRRERTRKASASMTQGDAALQLLEVRKAYRAAADNSQYVMLGRKPVGNSGGSAKKSTPSRQSQRHATHQRSSAEHADLILEIQTELCADDLTPPPESQSWSEALIRSWFEGGGCLTVDSIRVEPSLCIDELGAGLPVRELLPCEAVGPGGLLGALKSGDHDPFDALAERLTLDSCVACRLGASEAVYAALCAEGDAARAHMRPGELQSRDGSIISGLSPSGAPRGDVFVSPPELPGYNRDAPDGGGWPALAALDCAMVACISALAASLDGLSPRRRISLLRCSDGLFACFAGDGGRYGAHTDGGETNALSVILYSSMDWRQEQGGCLHMLDPGAHCWREVRPKADTALFFFGHRVVHKVEPCHHKRFAFTMFCDRAQSLDES